MTWFPSFLGCIAINGFASSATAVVSISRLSSLIASSNIGSMNAPGISTSSGNPMLRISPNRLKLLKRPLVHLDKGIYDIPINNANTTKTMMTMRHAALGLFFDMICYF